jgi:hypothetical protein
MLFVRGGPPDGQLRAVRRQQEKRQFFIGDLVGRTHVCIWRVVFCPSVYLPACTTVCLTVWLAG